ncbi:MAG: cytochrome c biogenesis protein [Candidatus Kapabacteria bacterium]|nr:cytochrome c biogenesis protein [Candidatus Kapabacteria bacterium]
MKAIILLSGIVLGLVLGLFPSILKPKPLIWKIITIILVTLTIMLSFLPPIGADVETASFILEAKPNHQLNLKGKITSLTNNQDGKSIIITDNFGKTAEISLIKGTNDVNFKLGDFVVMAVSKGKSPDNFNFLRTVSINPLLSLPYVPKLEEQIRILNFHVPMAWISVLAYLLAMIYSIRYLKSKDFNNDVLAASAAAIGTLFAILATTTGMIWAKFNWGSFWNWDPRETSIFILLLIYGAYFALRSAIDNPELKARLSSVYSIIAFITVPFLVFILPRLVDSLHPGSANDDTAGPILSTKEGTLNIFQQITFSLGFASFTAIFFWMFNIWSRIVLIFHKKSI